MKKQPDMISGVAWYKPEQWALLRSCSEDGSELEETYEQWVEQAEKSLREIRRSVPHIRKVEVDVNELIQWCQKQGKAVNPASRVDYVLAILKEQEKEYVKYQRVPGGNPVTYQCENGVRIAASVVSHK